MLPVMKVPMQYGTAGPSTVPPEPVVPETQVLPVMKVPMQYGTAGPSTVPATQISALISKDTTQNSTTLSTDKVAETPKTHSNVMLSISEVGSDDIDEVDSINTQAVCESMSLKSPLLNSRINPTTMSPMMNDHQILK